MNRESLRAIAVAAFAALALRCLAGCDATDAYALMPARTYAKSK